MQEEKKDIFNELQLTIDKLRLELDDQSNSQVLEDLSQQVRDLSFELSSKEATSAYYQQRSHDIAQELHRVTDDLAKLKVKCDTVTRDKDSLESQMGKQVIYWRERAEELAEYSEEQVDKYGQQDNKRKSEYREGA